MARLRRGHSVGQSVVVQSCGVQLGRFHGEVPTAIGGPAAGVWRSRADGPREVRLPSRASSQGVCGTVRERSTVTQSPKKQKSLENTGPEMT